MTNNGVKPESLAQWQDQTVQLPGNAFTHDEDLGVVKPSVAALRAMNLLSDQSQEGFTGVFSGPPASVSLIEAGGTALSKWWAAGAGATVVAIWAAVRGFWNGNDPPTQRTLLIAASIATAALVLAIGHLLASDIRGRAQAMAATIEARTRVFEAVTSVARSNLPAPASGAPTRTEHQYVPLNHLHVIWDGQPGWTALALRVDPGGAKTEVYVGKASAFQWVPAADVRLPAVSEVEVLVKESMLR